MTLHVQVGESEPKPFICHWHAGWGVLDPKYTPSTFPPYLPTYLQYNVISTPLKIFMEPHNDPIE